MGATNSSKEVSCGRFTTKLAKLKFLKLSFVTLLVTLQEQHTTLALSYPLNAYPAGFGTSKAPPLAPRLVGIRNDTAGLQQCFFGGEMVVFVVASAFKSVTLKLDVVKSIFLNIFVQDSRQTKF